MSVHNHGMGRYLAALAFAVVLLLETTGAAPALAAQDDPRLDGLFLRLKTADDAAEVRRITDKIWSIWLRSGRQEIDFPMLEGRRFMRQGILHSALGNFGTIVRFTPNFAEGWHKRAHVHYLMGNFTASIKDLEHTIALEPRHFGALAGLGLIFLKLGQERAALKALEKALEINPHLSGTRYKVEELRKKLDGQRT